MKRPLGRLGLLAATIALAAVTALPNAANAGGSPSDHGGGSKSSCHLGNGVTHVINIVFDNVHFARDNPNVPSDLEQMPHLLNFLKQNGTVFSNSHTPMIAHTADDSLTIYTGLYGDRHGQPVSNSYKTYNPDGSTDPATSFTYWTSPVVDTKNPPTAGHDATPSMVYSDQVPAKAGDTSRITPAPWVPFTRAGCTVGDFSTANMVLENAAGDLPTVFGANSPEVAQFNADPDSFKDAEIADYIGEAVHCAKGDRLCANAQAVKYGQTTASPTAVPDPLPTEPGGYNGYQALFGARYIAPQIGGGPNVVHHGYQVTDANGQPRRPRRQPADRAVQPPAGLPRVQPDRDAVARRPRGHAGGRDPGHVRLHLRPARDARRTRRPAARHREPERQRPAARPGRLLLRHERPALRRRVPEVLRAPRRRRHHAQEHAVRDQRRGERPVRRRERGPGVASPRRPAATASPRRATTPPARSASCRRTSTACSPAPPRAHAVRHRSRRAWRCTSTASRRRTTRRSASSSATRRR